MPIRQGVEARMLSNSALWALMAPLWSIQRTLSQFGRRVWSNRLIEASYPGLRVYPGAQIRCTGTLKVSGRVLLGRGSLVLVPASGILEFLGDNYLLQGSQIVVGDGGCVSVGARTTIDRDVIINGGVKIGRDCLIAPRVFISSSTHMFDLSGGQTIREMDAASRAESLDRQVVVGDNCWLGVGTVLLPGVHIGSHTVIGAGAVVTRSWPKGHQVLVGVPARPMPTKSLG